LFWATALAVAASSRTEINLFMCDLSLSIFETMREVYVPAQRQARFVTSSSALSGRCAIQLPLLPVRLITLWRPRATYPLASATTSHRFENAMTRTSPAALHLAPSPSEQAHAQLLRTSALQPSVSLFALGMIGLGVLALIYGDFAMGWQPVAPWVPGRTALAYSSGVIMLVCGAGLLFRATAAWSVRVLFPYLILWALLKVPALVVAPQIEGVWLGFGELAVLLAGGWVLFARLADLPPASPLAFAAGDSGIRIARYLFALWLIPIGLSHFLYVKETVSLIPPWIPFPMFWAWLTGAGHIAAGLGVLFSVVPRVAVYAEAAMLTIITLLVWAPAVVLAPSTRLPWTAFWISSAITAAVWVLAQGMQKEGIRN
jgi:uncharacterized membrane protein